MIVENPEPFVWFTDFGDSALIFQLLFYSKTYMNIGGIKSELRFEINRLFKEHNITIPFPQRDIWIREK